MRLRLQISLLNKSFSLCLYCLFTFSLLSNAQDENSYVIDKKIKYEFERYGSIRTSKVRQGDFLLVSLKRADSTIVHSGNLIIATSASITLDVNYEEKKYFTDYTSLI